MSKVTRLTGGQGGRPPLHQGLHLHEIRAEGASPCETVGQDLRAARLRRGDELGRISQALRIRKDYLEALETDRADKLPGRTYAIGFVRSYASYLGLDGPELVLRFKNETAGQAEDSPQVGPAPEPRGSQGGTAWTVFLLLLAGLLVYGVYELAKPAPSNPQRGAEVPASAAMAGRAIARRAPTTATQAPSVAVPKHAEPPPPLPVGLVFGAQNSNVRVVLRARGSTRVLVQGFGGKVYINRLLHPGDVYRVPNLVGLALTTPDGGAVGLELDGQDAGAAGQAGQMTEALSLDPQTIVDRKGAGPRTDSNKVTQ